MDDNIKILKNIEKELKIKAYEYEKCVSNQVKLYLDNKVNIREFNENVNNKYCVKEKKEVNNLIEKHNSITSTIKSLN